MSHSFAARYLTATRYALLEQARNRLALGLVVVFIPIWYYRKGPESPALLSPGMNGPTAFRFACLK